MTITAQGRKTTPVAPVGAVWALAVKAPNVPAVDADTAHPVRFRIARPDGTLTDVVATLDGDAHTADFVLDIPGDYTATALVLGEDGSEVDQLDGFKASAEAPVEDATATADEPTTDEPDPAPADAV